MALVRWNQSGRNGPTRRALFDDSECFYEDDTGYLAHTGRGRLTARSTPAFSPRIDVVNEEKRILLHAEIPGVDKDDLDVTITNDLVTIKGERKDVDLSESECFYCRESAYGVFERSVELPEPVVNDEVKASLKNGVLTLTLPKATPSAAVKIKVG